MNPTAIARITGFLGALAGVVVIANAQPAQAATITVTTQNDYFAVGPTGCSLRRAINAANNNSDYNGCVGVGPYGNDTIVFAPSIAVITLTLNTGVGDNDSNGYRDLDIGGPLAGDLSIIGPANGVTITVGAGIGDRVFDVLPTGSADVTLAGLRIVGGTMPATSYETGAAGDVCYQGGGGVRHRGGGKLTLSDVIIQGNTARAGGGVCHQGGRLEMVISIVADNTTQGRDGGGILSAGPAFINRSQVLRNTAVISEATARGGGGIFCSVDCGSLEVIGGAVSYNTAQVINTNPGEAHGGGIATRSPATLTQVSVVSNTASALFTGQSALGGGVYSAQSLVASQLFVVNNAVTATAFGLGGGLRTSGALAEINGGFILSNTATRGGGWYNTVSGALLIGSEVRFNRVTEDGGGLYNTNAGNVGIANAVICDNRAIGPAATSGGGLNNTGSGTSLYVQDSILCNNTAQSGGGAANSASARLTVAGAWITGNVATIIGGGVAHAGALLTIENSAITSNTASTAGGGLWSNASFSIVNSTVSANFGNGGGGINAQGPTAYLTYTTIASNTGIGLFLSNTSAHMRATLLAGNNNNCALFGSATLTSQNDNLSSDATCASLTASNDLTNTNPLLRPLGFASPFDFTPTHLPMPNSPALNRIPPARCIADDQRGMLRPQNGACDVGAAEMAMWRSYAPMVRKP